MKRRNSRRASVALVFFAAACTFSCKSSPTSPENPTSATAFSVYGQVYYSTSPLGSVEVALVQGEATSPPVQTTRTDRDGNYAFSEVANGSYHVRAYGPTDEFLYWISSPVEVRSSNVRHDIYLPKKMTLRNPPNDSIVKSLHPLLEWNASGEASRYMIQINVTAGWAPVELGQSTVPFYVVQKELTPGTSYTWQVEAFDVQNHDVGTTAITLQFTVTPP